MNEFEGNNPSRKRKKEEPGTPDLGERKKRGGRDVSQLCVSFYPLSDSVTERITHLQTCLGVGIVDDDEAQA